ncbi:MAG: hypothetical protein IM647_02510 [Phenylobacterium sp.]|nr:hypothetical protein [Phenylobacterium sp.]
MKDIDGVDLRAPVRNPSTPAHDALYWRAGTDFAIRKGDWKLIEVDLPAGGRKTFLFNLRRDPSETRDLAGSNPGKAEELRAQWNRWNAGNTPSRMTGRVTTTRIAGVEVLARY